MKFFRALAVVTLVVQAAAQFLGAKQITLDSGGEPLQDIVTYDEHSLMVHGERLFIFSGEFHPYRLPVPDLWLDVFEKIKALGFNTVSFYSHWALLEGKPGEYSEEGIFAFEPFFDAAKKAGIYLIARPGPVLNAESSGGGFPGWLQRVKGQLRTRSPDYLTATDNYASKIGASFAKAQITNGGPIILFQPENEYTPSDGTITGGFPDPEYFAYVKKQFRDAGIIVPFINNDAWPQGFFAPGDVVNGTTKGNVDIYGHDSYPLGFDCANPYNWPGGRLPTDFHALHQQQSPSTLYSINEFQGGAFDPWGGRGFDKCSVLTNMEFERVFYKNNFASGVTLFNVYMIFGGTNWGNHGHPGGYTSYDYGAAITENREVYREKYSELKLEAQFLKVSPDLLTSSVGSTVIGVYTSNVAVTTTPLLGTGTSSKFYIVRHTDYQQTASSNYTLNLETSKGKLSIPQIGGTLLLSGRDSKWHITDYRMGDIVLLYSTAEILTWKKFDQYTVLVVYGGPEELHELSVITDSQAQMVEGTGLYRASNNGAEIIGWQTFPHRRIVLIGKLLVYVLDRNTAYNYWVPDFPRNDKWDKYSSSIDKTTSVIVEAGYLIRSAQTQGSVLYIEGDVNATTPLKITGAPKDAKSLYFNGKEMNYKVHPITGEWSSTLEYSKPALNLPDLSFLSWKFIDNLPEIQPSYDDSRWTKADHSTSSNSLFSLNTPVSLFGSDYGFNTGVLIFRGHFVANGDESSFFVDSQGGSAFGSSVWLNSTYIGSWTGIDSAMSGKSTYKLPKLVAGEGYVLTVVVENNGLDENWSVGPDQMKRPRGILDYGLSGRNKADITWKLTGNLGGENYLDKARGPLNEGGLYAERQGFTQPNPPNQNWVGGYPQAGTNSAGIAFYQADFHLDLPKGYDIPLAFKFGKTTVDGQVAAYRVQLWVNGYQFGKYVNHIGPQQSFPVPQGILNYYGQNWLAVEIWAQQTNGAHLTDFKLEAGTPVLTSIEAPAMVPMPIYSQRPGAY